MLENMLNEIRTESQNHEKDMFEMESLFYNRLSKYQREYNWIHSSLSDFGKKSYKKRMYQKAFNDVINIIRLK